ncbi:hypothetical protein R6Z07M_009181 [Ovis aries]
MTWQPCRVWPSPNRDLRNTAASTQGNDYHQLPPWEEMRRDTCVLLFGGDRVAVEKTRYQGALIWSDSGGAQERLPFSGSRRGGRNACSVASSPKEGKRGSRFASGRVESGLQQKPCLRSLPRARLLHSQSGRVWRSTAGD